MNVPQDELNTWQGLARQMGAALSQANINAQAGRREQAGEAIGTAREALMQLTRRLDLAGAERPADTPQPNVVPLDKLDTSANREYLAALRQTLPFAMAVDRERYGSRIGTDGPAGGMIELLIDGVEDEIGAPVGTMGE